MCSVSSVPLENLTSTLFRKMGGIWATHSAMINFAMSPLPWWTVASQTVSQNTPSCKCFYHVFCYSITVTKKVIIQWESELEVSLQKTRACSILKHHGLKLTTLEQNRPSHHQGLRAERKLTSCSKIITEAVLLPNWALPVKSNFIESKEEVKKLQMLSYPAFSFWVCYFPTPI